MRINFLKNYCFLTVFIISTVFSNHIFGQLNYPFDPTVPVTTLDDNTKLTVLNARFGSRFSCSYAGAERGFHTGSLGFDSDDYREILLQVEVDGKMRCLRSSYLPTGAEYLNNQKLKTGLNAIQFEGDHEAGLEVSASLVSPFTVSNTLEDTTAIKIQISPAFYWVVKIKNISNKTISGNFKIGLKSIPYDRNRETTISVYPRFKQANQLFFKDLSSPNTQVLLSNLNIKNDNQFHFHQDAFHGLKMDFSIAPNSTFDQTWIYATHNTSTVIQDDKYNHSLKFYYLNYWKSIDAVVDYARNNFNTNIEKTKQFEKLLSRSSNSPEEKWVTMIAFRTDLANCFFLKDEKNKPRFYEVEGRFRHLSTMDVSMETELNAVFCPWRLKLQLEQWSNYVAIKEDMVPSGRSYTAGIKENKEGVTASEYGPYMYHDVGNYPWLFNAEGYDFGPCSPVEENTSFVMLMYWYWKISGDNEFVKRHLGLIDVLMYSLSNRDSDNSGLADKGIGWSTYDVSEAIKKAPENTYLGVKQMAAYEMAAELLEALPQLEDKAAQKELIHDDEDGTTLDGNQKANFIKAQIDNRYLRKKQAARCRAEATKIAATLTKTYQKYKYIPVSLDKTFDGWDQHSITISEGLFYAGLCNFKSATISKMLPILKENHLLAYKKCTSPYGIQLSSGEGVTWFSKAMVADLVAQYNYNTNLSSAKYTYEWNKNNANAFQDGAYSATRAWEGNWYPRGISALGYLFKNFTNNFDRNKFVEGLK